MGIDENRVLALRHGYLNNMIDNSTKIVDHTRKAEIKKQIPPVELPPITPSTTTNQNYIRNLISQLATLFKNLDPSKIDFSKFPNFVNDFKAMFPNISMQLNSPVTKDNIKEVGNKISEILNNMSSPSSKPRFNINSSSLNKLVDQAKQLFKQNSPLASAPSSPFKTPETTPKYQTPPIIKQKHQDLINLLQKLQESTNKENTTKLYNQITEFYVENVCKATDAESGCKIPEKNTEQRSMVRQHMRMLIQRLEHPSMIDHIDRLDKQSSDGKDGKMSLEKIRMLTVTMLKKFNSDQFFDVSEFMYRFFHETYEIDFNFFLYYDTQPSFGLENISYLIINTYPTQN